jgi:hypothetical protein
MDKVEVRKQRIQKSVTLQSRIWKRLQFLWNIDELKLKQGKL